MSFLKSFCGRVFVNKRKKNGNLHKKCLFSPRSQQQQQTTSDEVVKQQRRENIYTNEIRLVHYRGGWKSFNGLSKLYFFHVEYFDSCGCKKRKEKNEILMKSRTE